MSTSKFQSWLQASIVGCYLTASGAAVADDTDVFFRQAYRDTTKPNILFVIDTSGSMGDWPASAGSSGPVKMDIVKSAMKTVLDGLTNVNAGLARFTVPGGPILMPVQDLDLPADPVVSASIGSGNDDAEESTSGAMRLDSPDLDIVEESGHAQWVAIRFNKVDIPQGATVLKAIVSLAAWEDGSGDVNLKIIGEDSDNAAAFTTDTNNISGRPQTDAKMDWSITTNWTSGQRYSSVDIAPVIQEIVSRPGWCGGNSAVIMMRREGSGTNRRVSHAYESATPTNTTYHPKLNVQFSGTLPSGADGCYTAEVVSAVEAGADDVEQLGTGPMSSESGTIRFASEKYKASGLRFTKVRVPQGATIVDSYVKFRQNLGLSYTGATTNISVAAVNTDNFAAWTLIPNGLTGPALTKTSAVSVTLPDWLKGTTVGHSGNLNTVISAITGRAGWASGNSIGLIMTYTGGAEKRASSYEGKVAATLTVRYRGRFETGSYTVRDEMKLSTDQLVATGWTPLSDTMLEAGLYFRGEAARYGKSRLNNANNRVSNIKSLVAGSGSLAGTNAAAYAKCDPVLDPLASACASEYIAGAPVYKSPITDTCQANVIVFLTDGAPTWHESETSSEYARMAPDATESAVCAGYGDGHGVTGAGAECLVELARTYFDDDQSTALPDKQNIKSYFIGFDVTLGLLNRAAAAGGTTSSYEARDPDELATAFSDIIASIKARTNTFVTAGVTVNQTNRLMHLNQMYFSIFAPDVAPRWPGNLKRYMLGTDGQLYDSQEPAQLAVRSDGDQFEDGAVSWWSTEADGNEPKKGGAASKLTADRVLYTNVGDTTDVVLNLPGNRVHESNSAVTDTMLSVTAAERTKVLQWARGIDVLDEDSDGDFAEPNNVFGDPLHSRPTLVNYDDGSDDGAMRVFVGTNRGELHSIDTESGGEAWAFVPEDLLPHYDVLMKNEDATDKPYGLDSTVVPYLLDVNRDGKIKAADGDKAYLYVGMRRGGKNYYVLDVSERDNPKLKFVIEGGVTGSDYEKLAQTWSPPTIGKVKIGSADPQLVMIFGGGYSVAQDTATTPVDDTEGNAVFIADAEDGSLLWSSDEISGLAMNKSVPADVAAIDLSGDGLIDHVYAADMGAQIWRFNLKTDGTITGGKLANFQPDTTEANNRRFYGSPDVSMVLQPDGSRDVMIAIGSGWRENPLDENVTDHFYVFRDEGVTTDSIVPAGGLTLGSLVDITTLFGDAASEAVAEDGVYGWYLNFNVDGEKSLSAPVIFDNRVLFTTYIPPTGGVDEDCNGGAGEGRFYAVSILDGTPVGDREYVDPDGGGPTGEVLCTSADCRYTEMDNCPTCGFVPPQILFIDEPGTCDVTALVGTKPVDPGCPRERVKRVKWRHVQD